MSLWRWSIATTLAFWALFIANSSDQACFSDDSLFQWTSSTSQWQSPAVEYERLTSDRPHISEATSTVGLGRIQLESGYTIVRDSGGGQSFRSYSYPEPLLRIGVLREWLELRLGTNYLNQVESDPTIGAVRSRGMDDMYFGGKVALVKQYGVLPDLTIFPQMRIPTGAESLTAGRVLPGANIAYSWALSRRVELECNTVFNSKVSDAGQYVDLLQTANFEFDLGPRWIYFTEFYCFQPMSNKPTLDTQAYFHTGTQYFLLPEVQFDVHAAVGLNAAADNLSNTGVSCAFVGSVALSAGNGCASNAMRELRDWRFEAAFFGCEQPASWSILESRPEFLSSRRRSYEW